jgi:hypothetical protein
VIDLGRPTDQTLVNDLGGRWRIVEVKLMRRFRANNESVVLPNPQGYFQFEVCKLKESGNGSCPGVYEINGERVGFVFTANRQPQGQGPDIFYLNFPDPPEPMINFWGKSTITVLDRRNLTFVSDVRYQIPGVPSINDPVAEVTLAKE